MNLAIVGYGKMGRLIEQVAPQYGCDVRLRLDVDNNANFEGLTKENFRGIEAAVEFSTPAAAPENIERLARLGVNTVIGTTGWFGELERARKAVELAGTGLVWSANFSVGVNIFSPASLTTAPRILITQGRRSARGHLVRARNITVGVSIGIALAIVLTTIVFRKGASWPPSVTAVQTEIATACQNPNVASEPNQVNFACGKGTQQVLWVFSLLTSGDNPVFADSKSGRQGLEPITPAQGGEVAWSLDLHHPYNPLVR